MFIDLPQCKVSAFYVLDFASMRTHSQFFYSLFIFDESSVMNHAASVDFRITFYFLTFLGTTVGSGYCIMCDLVDHSSSTGVCSPVLRGR